METTGTGKSAPASYEYMLAPNGPSSNTVILAMHGKEGHHFSHHDLSQLSPAMGFQRNYNIIEASATLFVVDY